MSKMYTRFIWDGEHGELDYSLPVNHPVVPPTGILITTKFPIDGRFEKIAGYVSEVSIDYTQNEIVVHLDNVEVLG